ncbi:MAG: glycosyltransferase family 4 protein [bacterium]|nr:glycosyltransferase family 4 protein [bacterium]
MKILWITDNFLPHYGGSRVLYHQTMRRLPAGTVTLLTRRVPGWRRFDAASGIDTRRGFFRGPPGPAFLRELPVYAEMLARGAWLLLRTRPDAIVCGELLPTGLVGLLLSRMGGRPFLVYVHGEELGTYERLRGERRLAFSVLRAADAVLPSASEARAKALAHGARPDRVHLLTPGVADELLEARPRPERARARFGLEGRPLLLTVGRLVERKGHADVLRAVRALGRDFPGLAWLVAGTGPLDRRLRELARELGVEESVVFAGRLPDGDLADCYAACDVFVMPNRELAGGDTEGAGIVLLEAAAMGRPVVAGRAGGTGDSVVDGVTGFLVDPDRPGELEDRLRLLLGDRARARRMGEEGRRFVSAGRRWDDRARELLRICGALAGAVPSPPPPDAGGRP